MQKGGDLAPTEVCSDADGRVQELTGRNARWPGGHEAACGTVPGAALRNRAGSVRWLFDGRNYLAMGLDFSLPARACHEGAAWFLNSTTDLFFLSNKALCVSRVELASSMPVMHGDCQYPEMVLRLQASSERKTQPVNVETLGTGAKPKNLATSACLVNHILVCRVAPAAPPCRASAFCSSLVSQRPGSCGICREGLEFVVETSSVYCMDMFGVLVSGKP